jgi:outer membrane protein, heavy metal efflux system
MSRYFAAGILSVFTALAAPAQSVVTETEFLSALTRSHPAVIAASEEVALARAAVIEARALENPSIGIAREDPSGPVAQTELTLSWQLPDSSRRLRVETAARGLEAAEARLAHTRLKLGLEMREAYAAWAVAAAQRDRLSAQLERIDALTARERLRAERGESSGLEAHRLALAASALRARAALTAAAEQDAAALARSWNPALPSGARPALPDLPPVRPPDDDPPLIAAARAEVDAALAAQRAAGRFVRSPELMTGWQRQESGTESFDGPLLGLNWPLPLFRRNQGERVIADARLEAARANLEQIRRDLAARRAAATGTYQTLAGAVRELDAASAANERMLRGAEAAFLMGEASLTDLLETWRSSSEAEMAALEVREAALRALRELERLTASSVIEKEMQP